MIIEFGIMNGNASEGVLSQIGATVNQVFHNREMPFAGSLMKRSAIVHIIGVDIVALNEKSTSFST